MTIAEILRARGKEETGSAAGMWHYANQLPPRRRAPGGLSSVDTWSLSTLAIILTERDSLERLDGSTSNLSSNSTSRPDQ
jgi:hypothetical protein